MPKIGGHLHLGGTLNRCFRSKRRHGDHVHPMGGVSTLPRPALAIKARLRPKLRDCKSLNFQDMIGRSQEIEVEEVETVETVEATGNGWDSTAAVPLPA